MKYESEILYDLMKRDGLLNPSQDNLPYESELKEKYVDEVKGAYPKVIDYRPEWMNYNLGYYIPADFPIESIENVTSGTVNNVVPYAFKSAILLGNTLVNLLTKSNIKITSSKSSVIDYVYQLDTTKTYIIQYCINQLPELSDTSESGRAFKFEWYDGGLSKGYKNIYNKEAVLKRNTYIKIEPFSDNVSRTNFSVWCPNYTSGTLDIDIMIIEYQEGMENWDIPYFEGMQSVKMPVLTTTGKNLYPYDDISRTSGNTVNIWKTDILVKNGQTLTYSGNGFTDATDKRLQLIISPVKNQSIAGEVVDQLKGVTLTDFNGYKTLNITNDTGKDGYLFVRIVTGDASYSINSVQIEQGTQATSYEPYKSNILTANEEVELRKVGDVQDELNLLTGELTERISEIVADGVNFKFVKVQGNGEYNDGSVRFDLQTLNDILVKSPNKWGNSREVVNNNRLKTGFFPTFASTKEKDVLAIWNNFLVVVFSDTNIKTIEQANEWLKQNPITIQYKLATESIKTVDLTNVNQDGVPSTFRPFEGTMHIQTDGTPLKPLFNGEIPVEATTQNLASFVNLEGVERTVNEYEEIVGDDNNEQLL